ncbi:MAG: DUF2452 domain-containing protein, partial [Bacteroidota bacterium]
SVGGPPTDQHDGDSFEEVPAEEEGSTEDPNEAKPRESTQEIDPEKIAENPGLLPYASDRGSATIKPTDKGKIKGLAMNAMYEQTDMQLDQIKAQIELLARQANEIKNRMTISEQIYEAEMNIDPIVGRTYYLYRRPVPKDDPSRQTGRSVLSLVSPAEWGPNPPYEYIATIRLLADHTWEIIERVEREDE